MPQFAFLQNVYFNNSVSEYLLAAATFLAVLWGFLLARRVFINRLHALAKLTATHLDDLVVEMLQKVKAPECYVVALYLAIRPLTVHARFDRGLHMVVVVLVAYRIVTMIQEAVAYSVKRTILADGADAAHRDTAQT